MDRYYLDTSALAKVYRKESGSDVVDAILGEPGSEHLVSRITVVEMESVFALKLRTGEIDLASLMLARRRLEADLAKRRLLVAGVREEEFRRARRLLIEHGVKEALRTLDALQLSVALALKEAGLATVFVAADQRLCRVAEVEGFTTLNPEQPAVP